MGLSNHGGLLSGIGAAVSGIGKDQREERLMNMANERQIALERMRQEHQSSENKLSRDLTASEGSKNRQIDVGQMRTADERAKLDRESREREGAADRASAEKIARTRANATGAGARGKSRWTPKVISNESVGKDGINKTQEIHLVDNATARTLRQQGNMFIQQGSQPPKQSAPAAAERALLDNPSLEDDFLNKYGYLPAGFVKLLGTASEDTNTEEE